MQNGLVYYKRIHEVIPYIKDNYIITTAGEIFSDSAKFKNKETKLSIFINPKGYNMVHLMTENGMKIFQIHRLVALAFIYNNDPSNKTQVNHIDGNKLNNNVCNLEWVTPKQNMIHASNNNLLNPLYGEKHSQAKLNNEQVKFICEKLDLGIEYREIANQLSSLPFSIPSNIIELINKIHHRKNWVWMSKYYKFEVPINNVKLTLNDNQVHKVCEMLQNGIWYYKDIISGLGYNLDELDKKQIEKYRRCILDIKNRLRSVNISSQYVF